MAIKLEVKNLYKVFGEHPERAFKYIDKGLSKEAILEKIKITIRINPDEKDKLEEMLLLGELI